jgi:hypothetical protein
VVEKQNCRFEGENVMEVTTSIQDQPPKGKTRLSKRMVQTLGMLATICCVGYADNPVQREVIRKELESHKQTLAAMYPMLHHGDSMPQDKLEVSEEGIDEEIRRRSILSLREIIARCEGLKLEVEEAAKHKRSGWRCYGLRGPPSMVEVLAGKEYPKGRSCQDYGYTSREFEGYEEAAKLAKKVETTYSRTMNTLAKMGLVEKHSLSRYNKKAIGFRLTKKGLNVINSTSRHAIDNIWSRPTSRQQTSETVEAKPR